MSIIRSLVFFSFLILTISGCEKPPDQLHASKHRDPRSSTTLQPEQLLTVNDVPAETMREHLRSTYRLKPDRRFLTAVAAIHAFLSDDKMVTVECTFKDDMWILSYNDLQVGRVSETSDYPELARVLLNWSRQLLERYPLSFTSADDSSIQAEIAEFREKYLASELIEALQMIDREWQAGKHQQELLLEATRLLILLHFQAMDLTEVGDDLAGQALALLTLCKSLTESDLNREECILAWTLDYTVHAHACAQYLTENDPFRLFITRDDTKLFDIMTGKSSTQEARYLWLNRLAMKKDIDLWKYWLEKSFPDDGASLPLIKTMTLSGHFSASTESARILPELVMLSLKRKSGLPDINEQFFGLLKGSIVGETIGEFKNLILDKAGIDDHITFDALEKELAIIEQTQTGLFFSAKAHSAWYRSYFYSAVYLSGMHYLDRLASVQAAQEYARELGNSDQGTARAFQTWYKHLAEFAGGNADPRLLLGDFNVIPSIGVPLMWRSFKELEEVVAMGDPQLLQGAQLFARNLDSRPHHRVYLARLAKWYIMDLNLAEKAFTSLCQIDVSKYQQIRPLFAFLNEDSAALRTLLSDQDLELVYKADVIDYLDKLEALSESDVKQEYRKLLEQDHVDWNLWSQYSNYLEKKGEYQTARDCINKWLHYNRDERGFPYIYARTALARMFMLEGQYEQGLEAVKPVVDSCQLGAMQRYALILAKIGRTDEAEAMFHRIYERYPSSVIILASLTQLKWHRGDNAAAASLIASHRYPLQVFDWRDEIGSRFAEVYKDKPLEQGLAAFSELLALHKFEIISTSNVCTRVYQEGNPELAFQMISLLRSRNAMQDLTLKVEAYNFRKHWTDEKEAQDWLRSVIDVKMYQPLSQVAYDRQCYELLWDFIPLKPTPGPCEECVWLSRAAAYLKTKSSNTEQLKALRDYFKNDGKSIYYQLGRFLVGLTQESDVYRYVKNDKDRCSVGYYFGLKAQSEGRYNDASDWYRISIETRRQNTPAYSWAFLQLSDWNGFNRTLAVLARDHR
ncbi:hypothetical protein JXQ70_13530 [bacterium]|nr:hypothetical protein [bacterium]